MTTVGDCFFRGAGAWGAGLIRNLHVSEQNGNIFTLATAVDNLLAAVPGSTVSVSSAYQVGQDLFFVLSDSSELGPFTLPVVTINFTGPWQEGVNYVVNDLFTRGGALYQVIYPHLSVAPFNPGEDDGLGHSYYQLWVLGLSGSTPEFVSGSSYTLILGDVGKYKIYDALYGCLVTIPTLSAVGFTEGDEIHFHASTDGDVSFVVESDSIQYLRYESDRLPILRITNSAGTLKYIGVVGGMEEWHLIGSLRAA